jgi:adenylyltransferase/sulfurtransferase
VDERFDRFRRIEWWDQAKLVSARVLVIGAGALGNEILKNLALLGVGSVFVADLDLIERSNLSRSILYREADTGRPKAETAVQALRSIYPDMRLQHFQGNIIHELGLGVFRWATVVIGALDNREARLHVNRCCYRLDRPWVDGATESLRGIVRVFVPDGPCYECTLSAADWTALNERRGCAGLRLEGVIEPQVPTTPVTASVIGALETQEALKLIHDLPGLAGSGFTFDGLTNDSYVVKFQRGEDCLSHDALSRVVPLNVSAQSATLRALWSEAETQLGPGAVLELRHELLVSFECAACDTSQAVLRPLATVRESEALCPKCRQLRRPHTVTSITGTESFIDRTWQEVGLPPFDIVAARLDQESIGLECAADAAAVLGQLYDTRG